MTLERHFVERRRIERVRSGDRPGLIVRRMACIEQRLGHCTVEQAGVEMPKPVMRRETLAKRALAGSGRPIDCDDHERSAPRLRIMSANPGKLVAMNAASSTFTGSAV